MFGVAILASIFSANGSYASAQAFVDGMVPALQLGAVVVGLGAVIGLAIGGRPRTVVDVPERVGRLGGPVEASAG